jgi:hypothetical protein
MTIVQHLQECLALVADRRHISSEAEARREFSIAITAIEDAIMRVNRGFAKERGTFKVSDVEGP